MKSLSEIDTVSKRSCRAAGYSWGVAEEVGKNIRLLEIFSFPGIKNLNEFFKKKKNLKLEYLSFIDKKNYINNSQYCPIIAGVNFLDQIRILKNMSEFNIKNMAYPMLFLPFISRASETIGKRIHLKFDNKDFLMNFNNNINCNSPKKKIIKIAKKVSIKILDNEDSFNESEWKDLYKLSEKTFVEESESLKQSGAGAGLTDND